MFVAQHLELCPTSRLPSTAPARLAFLLLLLTSACGDDETDARVTGGDAGRLDGGASSLDRLDASDAMRPSDDARAALCYSPVQAPEPGLASVLVSRLAGCACPVSSNTTGYCINDYAVRCYSNGWGFGEDGLCSEPREPYAAGSCARRGGTLQTKDTGCPSGFDTLARYRGDAGVGERAPCCIPIEVSAQNCSSAGLLVEVAAMPSNKLETACPGDAGLRAFVVGESATSVCCAR